MSWSTSSSRGSASGIPSLLTGMAPAFTVRAHEPVVTCYLIPGEHALTVLGRPAGASFVAASLRERLTRTGHVVHALPETASVQVGDLVTRAPIFCQPEDSIRQAAQTMTDSRLSAILVSGPAGLEILTDAALRRGVVLGDVSPDDPVSRLAVPAVVVAPTQLAVEATVDMLDSEVEHLAVVDPVHGAIGLLSASDILQSDAHSPFALRHGILRARDEDELVAVAATLPRLFLALHSAALPPADIGRVLTLQVESLTSKLIDFAIERRGPAPVAWAWLALGSAARREFTLASDQENALAYADGDDHDAIDTWFERFAADVNRGLARCRWPPDPNQVLAESSLWRMSEPAWIRTFEECLVSPDRSHLMRANVAFDFRQIGGGLSVTPSLVAVLRRARGLPRLPATDRAHGDRHQAAARLPRIARGARDRPQAARGHPHHEHRPLPRAGERHHDLGHRRASRGGARARRARRRLGGRAARGRGRRRAHPLRPPVRADPDGTDPGQRDRSRRAGAACPRTPARCVPRDLTGAEEARRAPPDRHLTVLLPSCARGR